VQQPVMPFSQFSGCRGLSQVEESWRILLLLQALMSLSEINERWYHSVLWLPGPVASRRILADSSPPPGSDEPVGKKDIPK
jgi:hypothetical protein